MKPFVKLSALMAVMLCLSACGKNTEPALGLDSTSAFETTEAMEIIEVTHPMTAAGTTARLETTGPEIETTAPQLQKPGEKTDPQTAQTQSFKPQPSAQTAQKEKPIPATEPPFKVTVTNPVTEQKGYDRETGKTLVLTFSYDGPVITLPGREDASQKINDYLRNQEDTYVSGVNYEFDPAAPQGYENHLADAQARNTQSQADGSKISPASVKRRTELVRADERVVSVLIHSTTDNGDQSHSQDTAYVFSAETGNLLSFTELPYDRQIFEDFLIDWMVKKAKSDPSIQRKITYFGEELYPDRFRDVLKDGNWYLETDTLVLFTRDFGGDTAGTVEFRVPFKDLNGMLNTRYQ